MSRTRHKLQSEDWYGGWARYFHKENREMRQRGREKRRRDTIRVEQDQYTIRNGVRVSQDQYAFYPDDFDE
jgi:hypothetical protein